MPLIYHLLSRMITYYHLFHLISPNFTLFHDQRLHLEVLDGFPIVLLWFLISPLASRIPLAPFESKYSHGPMPFINRAWGKDLMTVVNPVSAITYIEAAAQVRKVAMLRQNEARSCLRLLKKALEALISRLRKERSDFLMLLGHVLELLKGQNWMSPALGVLWS